MEKPVIFLVEDHSSTIEIMTDYFTAKGFLIICKSTGEAALNKIRHLIPDLIIMDIRLPGINGIEVIKEIRSNKKYDNVPIIVLTASLMSKEKERSMKAGADFFLSKPFSLRKLEKLMTDIHSEKRNVLKPNI